MYANTIHTTVPILVEGTIANEKKIKNLNLLYRKWKYNFSD